MIGAKDGIETCHELLHGIHKLTKGKMHVPQKTLVKKALDQVFKTQKWKMKPAEKTEKEAKRDRTHDSNLHTVFNSKCGHVL